jgi:crotonobetainyl-CoA:carnitine CoA-transferase CaiB-like acyl-CoA transferase
MGLIEEAWRAVAGDSDGQVGRALSISGSADALPSPYAVQEVGVACVSAALLAAAALARQRSGAALDVHVDRDHVAAAVTSERSFRVDGRAAGAGFAPLSRFWRTSDGWARTHANYPWHRTALLDALQAPDEVDAVESAIRSVPSLVLEDLVVGAGGVAAAVRGLDQWRRHPQGAAVQGEPLVGYQVVGNAPPRRRAGSDLPADGIRVLDLTRVIAGPVCTRFLGALGADVLRIDPPAHLDMPIGSTSDTLLGKRSSALDLAAEGALPRLHGLLDEADLVVCGYRPGSLDGFGLAAGELTARHPGLVAVFLSAWGTEGPWATRRGFDSIVQAATGIADGASEGGSPGVLPCQLLDHGTGYLAAAAALDGLVRQSRDGGTHLRHLSLAGTAAWLTSAEQDERARSSTPIGRDSGWMVELDGESRVTTVAPPGSLGGRPLRWPGPPTNYLADRLSWRA